ncbi:MAG: hypothetical protein RR215_03345, partial [Ruthenibacterium sp.]
HVSMDAVSVTAYCATENRLTLTLTGVPGTKEQYFVHLPDGTVLQSAQADGASLTCTQAQLLIVSVAFQSDSAKVTLCFESAD